MNNYSDILSSFKVQNELNPKFWGSSDKKLNSKIRDRLLEIAYEFIEFFDLFVSSLYYFFLPF